jgi:hypothetical protein
VTDAVGDVKKVEVHGIAEGKKFGIKGICQIDGGRLRLCLGEKDYPDGFETKKGDGRELWVFKK